MLEAHTAPAPLTCPVLVANTPDDTNALLETHVISKNARSVGLDTETRVFVGKGPTRPVSIIQIATTEVVIIVQIFQIWLRYNFIPERLVTVLADPGILKCGVAISGDSEKLLILYGLRLRGLVDLESLAGSNRLTAPRSLGDLARHYYGNGDPSVELHSPQNRRATLQVNWEAEVLSPEALRYAATDAITSAKLLFSIFDGKVHPDAELQIATQQSPEVFHQSLKDTAVAFFAEGRKRMGENFPLHADASLVNMLANSCRDFALLPDKRGMATVIVNDLRKNGFFAK